MGIGGQSVSVEVWCSSPSLPLPLLQDLPLPLPGKDCSASPFRASA